MQTATSSASARSVGHGRTRSYFKTKRTLTALTVAASLIVSGAYAFEMNTTRLEENRILRKPMVGDLAVGVKALLSEYDLACIRNGKIYLHNETTLQTDQSDYSSYYEIIKGADGGFAMIWVAAKKGGKKIPYLDRSGCDEVMENNPQLILYPINSINGFTDRRSFIIDLINKGYE